MLNISRNLAIDKTRSKEIKKEQRTDRTENVVNKVERENFIEFSPESIGVKELLNNLNSDHFLEVARFRATSFIFSAF